MKQLFLNTEFSASQEGKFIYSNINGNNARSQIADTEKGWGNTEQNEVRDRVKADLQALSNSIDLKDITITARKYDTLGALAFGVNNAATAKWKLANPGKALDKKAKDINITWATKVNYEKGGQIVKADVPLKQAQWLTPGDEVIFKVDGNGVATITVKTTNSLKPFKEGGSGKPKPKPKDKPEENKDKSYQKVTVPKGTITKRILDDDTLTIEANDSENDYVYIFEKDGDEWKQKSVNKTPKSTDPDGGDDGLDTEEDTVVSNIEYQSNAKYDRIDIDSGEMLASVNTSYGDFLKDPNKDKKVFIAGPLRKSDHNYTGGFVFSPDTPKEVKLTESKQDASDNFNDNNGVFGFDADGNMQLFTYEEYQAQTAKTKFKWAFQNGPILLNDGVCPHKEESKAHRAGIGYTAEGQLVYLSTEGKGTVTFKEFADMFTKAGCENAIYLDGAAASDMGFSVPGQTPNTVANERRGLVINVKKVSTEEPKIVEGGGTDKAKELGEFELPEIPARLQKDKAVIEKMNSQYKKVLEDLPEGDSFHDSILDSYKDFKKKVESGSYYSGSIKNLAGEVIIGGTFGEYDVPKEKQDSLEAAKDDYEKMGMEVKNKKKEINNLKGPKKLIQKPKLNKELRELERLEAERKKEYEDLKKEIENIKRTGRSPSGSTSTSSTSAEGGGVEISGDGTEKPDFSIDFDDDDEEKKSPSGGGVVLPDL